MTNLRFPRVIACIALIASGQIAFGQNFQITNNDIQNGEGINPALIQETTQFRKNEGQWSPEILYGGYFGENHINVLEDGISFGAAREIDGETEMLIWNVVLENKNQEARISSNYESISNANYFKGNDPSKWVRHAKDYAEVNFQEVYNGIDLRYYADKTGNLKYDFILAPQSDASNIQLRYDGIEALSINRKGELEVVTPWGTVIEDTPYSYQVIDGVKHEVDVRYHLKSDESFGFQVVGNYNPHHELIIDPIVVGFSTFIGRQQTTVGPHAYIFDVAYDADGYIYGTGWYTSQWITTPGVVQSTFGGEKDAFVFKMEPDGSALVYATFLGGDHKNQGGDAGNGIVADDQGNAYITGRAGRNFPTTAGAYQGTFNGGLWDTFLTKLSPDGTQFGYSTYIGSSGNEMLFPQIGTGMGGSTMSSGSSVDVNSNGEAFVASYSQSAISTTPGAFQSANNGSADAFVVRMNANGTNVVKATMFGGAKNDCAYDIKVNNLNEVFITGGTQSDAGDFPTTVGAFNTNSTASTKIFVTKMDGNLNPIYSTFIGKGFGTGIDIDAQGYAYVTGGMKVSSAAPADLPVTAGAFQQTFMGGGGFGSSGDIYVSEGFVLKLNPAGNALEYCSYLGGGGDDHPRGIAVNTDGEAFITGTTWSPTFPVTSCAIQSTRNGSTEGFICKVNAAGSNLDFATYWGGQSDDYWSSIDIKESRGCVVGVLTGRTSHSTDLMVTSGAYQTLHGNGGADQPSVMELVPEIDADFTNATPACNVPMQFMDQSNGTCIWKNGPWTPTSWFWDFGDGTTSTLQNPTHTFQAGTYDVKLVIGCPGDSITKTINVPGPFNSFDLGDDRTKCQGPLNEVLDAGSQPSGTTFSWSTGATTQSITATSENTYWVTISKDGCTMSDTVVVKLQQVTGSVDKTDVTCFGGNDGSITALPQGGNPPYTYSWDGGQNTQTADNLPAGTHTVTVTDQDGCSIMAPITIDQPDDISITANPTDASCAGSDGSATATATGGTGQLSYSWTDGTTVVNNQTITNVPPNTYTVTVTDENNCTKTETAVVGSAPSNIQGTITFKQDAGCATSDGVATVTPSGGTGPYTYLWSDPAEQKTRTASNLAAGTYTVDITDDNGCTGSTTVTIDGSGGLTATIEVNLDEGCDRNGGTTGSATVTATGGQGPYTYLWDNGQTDATAIGLTQGIYNVTVTDVNGCSTTGQAELKPRIILNITIGTTPCATCNDGEVTVNVSGTGTPPFTYRWDDENEQTTATATGLKQGRYVVLVTDSNGCFIQDSVDLGIVGIEDYNSLAEFVSIYPNPNNGNFKIAVEDPHSNGDFTARIFDVKGRLILNKKLITGVHRFDLSDKPDGLYLIEVLNGQGRFVQRVQVIN